MSKFGQHLGSAASGAAVGTTIAPGIGTAVGAGAGLLASLLGGANKKPIEMTSGRAPADEKMAALYRQYLTQQMTQPNLYAPIDDLSMKAANTMSSMYYGEPYEMQGFQPFNPTDVGGEQSFDPIQFETPQDRMQGFMRDSVLPSLPPQIRSWLPKLQGWAGYESPQQEQPPAYYKPPTGKGGGPKKMPYAR